MKDKLYSVEISYTVDIEAKDEEEAEKKAIEMFDEWSPRSDEMNISIKEVK